MKKNIPINIDSEKLSALNMYLAQKNLILADELEKCLDGLYQKTVPQNVREFIELKSACPTSKGRCKVKATNSDEGEVKQ